jgi:hypothetical protein
MVMDEGMIVLVRLPALLTGTIQSLLGTAMVNQIMNTAFQRAEQVKEDRVPVAFFCDEFHLFATTDFDNLFNGGGKFHIMTAVAHQQLRQLHERPQVMTAALGDQGRLPGLGDGGRARARQALLPQTTRAGDHGL